MTEVTQAQYEQVTGANPSNFKGEPSYRDDDLGFRVAFSSVDQSGQ
jgi:hypothetical protein